MKHIKLYRLFENVDNFITDEDIRDIYSDLTDTGNFMVNLSRPKFYIGFFPESLKSIHLICAKKCKWTEIEDTLLRVKDYLGDKYYGCWYKSSVISDFIKINLNEDTYKNINDNIHTLIISYKVLSNIQVVKYQIRSNDIKYIVSKYGNPIDASEKDLLTIDDLLMSQKNYSPGKHSDNPFLYGRNIIQYPFIDENMNLRSGYTWFLNSYEFSFNKFSNNYYLVRIKSNSSPYPYYYLCKGLESVIDITKIIIF